MRPDRSEGEGPQWKAEVEGDCIKLSILARTEENARTLRSDFMVSREKEGGWGGREGGREGGGGREEGGGREV